MAADEDLNRISGLTRYLAAALLMWSVGWFGCKLPEVLDGEDIDIGLVVAFDVHRGAVGGGQLAVDEINAAGGLAFGGLRRRLSLIAEDSERRPEVAVSKALKLINHDQVVALLGLPRSAGAIPVSQIAERNGVPMISTMSTHPDTTLGKSYVWRLTFLNEFQAEILAGFAVDELGAGRAATLVDAADDYSTDLGEAFRQAFVARGGEIVLEERFTEDDMDITEKLERIRLGQVDVLFMPYYPLMVEVHVKAARDVGLSATLIGGDSWSMMFNSEDRPTFDQAFFSDIWAPDLGTEKARAFIENYRRRFGLTPTPSAALTYDAVYMVTAVIRDQEAADPESIRAGLSSIRDFRGVTGTITFGDTGDPFRSLFIRRVDADGEIRLHKEIRPASHGVGGPRVGD